MQFFEILRFCSVGFLAAITNFLIVVAGVQLKIASPLMGNAAGFFIAFLVSFSGHYLWTFSKNKRKPATALPMFLGVAILGFTLNQSLFYFLLTKIHLPYPLALLLVLMVIATFSFTCSKYWVFAS